MGMLLAFAPFLAFALLDRLVGSVAGLLAGLLVSGALLIRDWLTPGRTQKLLEIGTLLLFGGLAAYTAWVGATWSVIAVRLCVDLGLLIIVVMSILVGRPFTLQYAREQVAPEVSASPEFMQTNLVISAAWGLAFGIMVLAEAALLLLPGLSHRVGVAAIVLALIGAVKFTGWYPGFVTRRAEGRADRGEKSPV